MTETNEPRGGAAEDAGPDEVEDAEVAEGDGGGAGAPRGRPWFRRLSFLVPAGFGAGMFGAYFVGLVAGLLFLTDRSRDRYLRAGGALLLLWWLWTWTLAGTSPYIGAGLLVASAALLAVAARAAAGPARVVTGVVAVVALVLAGVGLVPNGIREPAIGEAEALRRTLEARRGHAENVRASQADVVPTRARFTNRPYYFVVLHEQNPDTAVTGDGEPCFRRAEVHLVDGLDGTVERQRRAEAREEDGFCLPLRVGTKAHLVPVSE